MTYGLFSVCNAFIKKSLCAEYIRVFELVVKQDTDLVVHYIAVCRVPLDRQVALGEEGVYGEGRRLGGGVKFLPPRL